MSRPGIKPVTSRSLECTLYLLRYWGWLLYGMAWRARNGVLYGLVGTVGYLVWPSVHGKVYAMAWKASQGTGGHCMVYELQQDKTNKITCSPRSAWASGQSDVHMKKPWILSYQLSVQWMPRLIWVFAECTCHFVGFVMLRLIWYGQAKYVMVCGNA